MMHSANTSLLLCSLQPTGFHERENFPNTNALWCSTTHLMMEVQVKVEAVELEAANMALLA